MPVGYSIYRDVRSPVHDRVDPRTKLLWLLSLFVIVLCFNHPAVLGAIFVGLLVVARLARLRWRDLRAYLLMAAWLAALSVVLWPAYVHDGVLLGRVGPVEVTDKGVLFGLAMGLRVGAMIVAAAVWMLTTSPQRITAGLLAVGLPYKAGLALSSTIRFIPLMNAERTTIMEAQRARGLELGRGNPVRRTLRAAPVLVPLFTRAFLTAQNLSIAMDARGFGARGGRTSIIRLTFGDLDRVLCALAVAAVVASVVLRILGLGVIVQGLL